MTAKRSKPKASRASNSSNHDNPPSMLIGERRRHLLGLIERDGRVLVLELSKMLGISAITIRKDLDFLAAKGLVQRTHGGALTPHKTMVLDPSLKEKETYQIKEKKMIAEAAAAMVQEGYCVLLDSGTTTTEIARALRRFNRLTVVTNALNIAAELSDTDFDIILIGGNLRKNSRSLVGPLAEDVLQEIRADILFLGVDGFDVTAGVTTPNVQEARINRVMVKVSRKVVAVCDATKFERRSLALIVPPSAIHTVITDRSVKSGHLNALRSAGVEVIVV